MRDYIYIKLKIIDNFLSAEYRIPEIPSFEERLHGQIGAH